MPDYSHLENMAPLLVQVELTEACNLRCRFCYNSQKPRYNTRALDILERLAEEGVMQVTLTGGEPLMHPSFFDILKKATELFPNVMILSNGTMMDGELVSKIHEHNVLSVSVSVHGNKAIHDYLTGVPGSYERSVQAIHHFLQRDRIPIASNFVLNAANLPHLAATIQKLACTGLKFMTITRFIPTGVGKSAAQLAITGSQLAEAFRVVHQHLETQQSPHIEVAEATPFCALPPELQYLANTCSYGYDRFYVDVDGNVMVCGLSRISLGGNVLASSLSEIRKQSAVYRAFLDDDHVPAECSMCSDFGQCHGGCRAAAMSGGSWKGSRDFLMVKESSSQKN